MATVTAMDLKRATEAARVMATATEAARVMATATEAAKDTGMATEAVKDTGMATTTEAVVATGTAMVRATEFPTATMAERRPTPAVTRLAVATAVVTARVAAATISSLRFYPNLAKAYVLYVYINLACS